MITGNERKTLVEYSFIYIYLYYVIRMESKDVKFYKSEIYSILGNLYYENREFTYYLTSSIGWNFRREEWH